MYTQDRRSPALRRRTDVSTELMDVLIALHHPTRRWLAELLWVEGPATVGRLAARTGPRGRQRQPPPQAAAPAGLHRARPRAGPRHPREAGGRPRRAASAGAWRTSSPTASAAGWPTRRSWRTSATRSARCSSGSGRWPTHRRTGAAPAGATDSLVKATADQTADLHRRPRRRPARRGPRRSRPTSRRTRTPTGDRSARSIRCFPSQPVRP